MKLGIVQILRNREIPGHAAGPVFRRSGPGPTIIFMDGDRQHAILVMKGILHAVSVMGIEIDIKDTGQSAIEHGQDAKHRIVEVTEPVGHGRAAVMGAARERVNGPALDRGQGPASQQGRPGGRRRTTENLRKNRVAAAADIIALLHGVADMPVPFGRDDSGDVIWSMEAGEIARCRRRAVDKAVFVKQAKGADEIHDGRHPLDRERVRRAITRFPVDFAADHDWLCRKGGRDQGIEPRRKEIDGCHADLLITACCGATVPFSSGSKNSGRS